MVTMATVGSPQLQPCVPTVSTPAPLVAAATLKASRMAAERAGLSRALRLVVLEQAAVMNSVIAARAAMPRGWLTLYPERAEVGGDVEERR